MSAFSPAEIRAYLDRIGYTGPVEPTWPVLAAVHWTHLQRVPFENLDIIHYHRPLRLEPRALYAKIVGERRGGYCYELNGLLAETLSTMGFRVRHVMVQFIEEAAGDGAREDESRGDAARGDGARSLSPEFDHLALIVTIPGEPGHWLVDVGSGRIAFARPLPLRDGLVERQPEVGTSYRLTRVGGRWELAFRVDGEEAWTPRHSFTEAPRRLSDFEVRSRFFQTNPESPFRRGPMATLSRPGGRVTVFADRLVTTTGGERVERPLAEGELDTLLESIFGIRPPLPQPGQTDG